MKQGVVRLSDKLLPVKFVNKPIKIMRIACRTVEWHEEHLNLIWIEIKAGYLDCQLLCKILIAFQGNCHKIGKCSKIL